MHRTPLRVALVLAAVLLVAPAARAASPDVVISQAFAAGGNAGAAYANDFAELFNRGSATVDLTGWTVQYASAAGTTWQATPLTGTLAPGRHYLVQLASGGAVGAALSATTAAVRAGSGCTDTDANAADFATAAPAPLNSGAAAAACGAVPPPAGSVVQSAAVDVDIAPVLSIALERPTLSFGSVFTQQAPPALSEGVTVVSNNPAGYSLTVHRAAFSPADLPLGISVGGGALTPIPVAPALDLLIGSSSTASSASGDVWSTSIGFPSLPTVAPGRYTSTVVFTAIGR
jgi:hypothetical protein